jgi:hypothetical protein
MKGLECHFTVRDTLRCLLPTAIAFLCLVLLLRLSHRLGFLPVPPVALDPDTTVLAHQARASRSRDPARILLLGDSTCLVGVDALALSQQIPSHPRVLSLALFIWLDLNAYAEALSNFAAANPGQVRAVVLLVVPHKLAQAGSQPGPMNQWRQFLHDDARSDGESDCQPWQSACGARLLRQRWLSRLMATPLGGDGASVLGFSSQIDAFMTEHRGSLIDLGPSFSRRRAPRLSEPHLAPEFETESRAFRAKVPPGAKLFLGLTPGVTGFSAPASREDRDELLRQWNRWMQADGLLTNLPPTLPKVCFSTTAHLNPIGQKRFTAALARELALLVEAEPPGGPP